MHLFGRHVQVVAAALVLRVLLEVVDDARQRDRNAGLGDAAAVRVATSDARDQIGGIDRIDAHALHRAGVRVGMPLIG